MFSPQVEQALVSSLQPTEQGTTISLEPTRLQRLIQRVAQEMERMAAAGHQPVLLCSPRARAPFRRATERSLPNLMVLSFGEVSPQVNVQSFAILSEGE
jgi:flagellar biosynthesis protein FlhA